MPDIVKEESLLVKHLMLVKMLYMRHFYTLGLNKDKPGAGLHLTGDRNWFGRLLLDKVYTEWGLTDDMRCQWTRWLCRHCSRWLRTELATRLCYLFITENSNTQGKLCSLTQQLVLAQTRLKHVIRLCTHNTSDDHGTQPMISNHHWMASSCCWIISSSCMYL